FAPGDRRKRLARLEDRCAARHVVADEPLRGPTPVGVDERVARPFGTRRGGLRVGLVAVCGVRQELRAASRGGQIGYRRGRLRRRRARRRPPRPRTGQPRPVAVEQELLLFLELGPKQAAHELPEPLRGPRQHHAPQVVLHLAGVGISTIAVLGERTGDDRVEGGVAGIVLGGWRRLVALDALQREHDVVLLERIDAGEHFVKGDPDGEDVGALVQLLRQRLLRAHVDELPFDHPRFGLDRAQLRLRDSEVDDLHVAAVRNEEDRKSTRLNSSHGSISYAVFCLKKKKTKIGRKKLFANDIREHIDVWYHWLKGLVVKQIEKDLEQQK